MKIKELRTKHAGELAALLEEKRLRLSQLRFSIVRGEIKNVREISQVKRDIARMLTLMKTPSETSLSQKKA